MSTVDTGYFAPGFRHAWRERQQDAKPAAASSLKSLAPVDAAKVLPWQIPAEAALTPISTGYCGSKNDFQAVHHLFSLLDPFE